MWTAAELNQALQRIAQQPVVMAPILSGYFNRDEEGRLRFEQQAARSLGEVPRRYRQELSESIRVARGLMKWGESEALGFFIRGGERMFLFQIPLPHRLANKLEVGQMPALYEACRILDDYDHFRMVHIQPDRVDIAHFELGGVDFQLSFRAPYRSRNWRVAMMEVLRQAEQRYRGSAPPWLLAAPEEVLPSARRLLRGAAAEVAVREGAEFAEVVPAAMSRFREHEEEHSRIIAQRLLRNSPHVGTASVLQALARSRVATLALTARKTNQAALVHEDAVWFAKRCGADVEIVRDSPALTAVGGMACL